MPVRSAKSHGHAGLDRLTTNAVCGVPAALLAADRNIALSPTPWFIPAGHDVTPKLPPAGDRLQGAYSSSKFAGQL